MRQMMLLFILLICSPIFAQDDDSTWDLVLALGRQPPHHIEQRGDYILVAGYDIAYLYDADTLEDVVILQNQFNSDLSVDGRYLYGYRSDGYIPGWSESPGNPYNVIYEIATGETISLEPESSTIMRVSYDGTYLSGHDADGLPLIWRAPDFTQPIPLPDVLRVPEIDFVWSPAANQLLALIDHQLILWTVGEPEIDHVLMVDSLASFTWSPNGTAITLRTETPERLIVIDAQTFNERFQIPIIDCAPGGCFFTYRWRPDDEHLATVTKHINPSENYLYLSVYDSVTGEILHEMTFYPEYHIVAPESARYSLDSTQFEIQYQHYDADTFERVDAESFVVLLDLLPDELAELHRPPRWAEFDSSGDWLFTGYYDGTVELRDSYTGEVHHIFDGVLGWDVQPDGQHVVLMLTDERTVQVWSIPDQKLIHEITYDLPIEGIWWDRTYLLTAHPNTNLAWNLSTGAFADRIYPDCLPTDSIWEYSGLEYRWIDDQLLTGEVECISDSRCDVRIRIVCGENAGDVLTTVGIDQAIYRASGWDNQDRLIVSLRHPEYLLISLDGTTITSNAPYTPGLESDSETGSVFVLDENGETQLTISHHHDARWSPNRRWITASVSDHPLQMTIFDAQTGEETLQVPFNRMIGLRWGNDDVLMTFYTPGVYSLYLWRVSSH